MKQLILICLTLVLAGLSLSVTAQPWRPKQGHTVLIAFKSAQEVPIKLANNFATDAARNAAVNRLMQRAYLQGDSRALGQAESLMRTSIAPNQTDNLLLKARVAQANHRFAEAEQLLLNVLTSDPQQYDAMLQLANISRLQGKFAQSLQYCSGLQAAELAVYRFGCELQVNAMQLNLMTIQQLTKPLAALLPQLTQADQEWLANIQLEVATRFNDPSMAKQALPYLARDNLPNSIAKANWFSKQKQPLQVLRILKDYAYHDGALIRIIQSKQAMNDVAAKTDLQLLSSRMKQLQARQEQIHLREEAQYLLLTGQLKRGLQVAAQNWQIQRESDDFQVFAALSLASKNQGSAKTLLNWAKQVGYQDPQYMPALQRLANGASS